MLVVPEKRQLEDHVHGAVTAQFWSQGIENSRCLSGLSCTSPCEPQPLGLTAPSGLSRTQFLVATRAARLPIFPGYCEEHGGTVVDRVLFQSGAQKWWGAVIGRAKLQRGWNQHTSKRLRENLSDPSNYALAATGRLQLSANTVIKATLQSDSLQALQPLLPQQWPQQSWPFTSQQHLQQQHPAAQHGSSSGSNGQQSRLVRLVQGNSLKLHLKQQLEGLDLTADLAINEACVEGVTRYASTPLRLCLDVAPSSTTKRFRSSRSASSSSTGSSKGSSSVGTSTANSSSVSSSSSSSSGGTWLSGVLFRVGLHGVVAPLESDNNPLQQEQRQQQQHGLSLHAQGALALAGSKSIWEAAQKPWQAAATAAAAAHRKQQKQQQTQQQQQAPALPLQPLQDGTSSSSSAAAKPAASTAGSPPAVSSSSSRSSTSSSKSSTKAIKHQPQNSSAADKGSRHTGSSSRAASGSKKQVLSLNGQEIQLPLCNPGSVQDSIQEATSSIERMRTDLRSWQTRVEAGDLQHIGHKEQPQGLLARTPGSCWSSFIPGPHFKVSGLIGLLGRVPLHQQTLLLPAATSRSLHQHQNHQEQQPQHQQLSRDSSSTSTDSRPASAASQATSHEGGQASTSRDAAADADAAINRAAAPSTPKGGRPLGHMARSVLSASATHLDRLVVGSAKKLGNSIANESLVRLFGSAGASLQVGEMRGNFLDFSRLEVVLDLGLNGPETPAPPPSQNPARGGSARKRTAAATATRSGTAATGKGMVRVASPARGLTSILGPAAAAAAAAAQPLPLPPSLPTTSSGDHSPRSSVGLPGASTATLAAPAGGADQDRSGSSTAAAAAAGPVSTNLGATGVAAAAAAGATAGAAVRRKHPAFALDDRGVWNALTVSAAQQLFGPVRLRGDWRFALDSIAPCPRGTGLLQPSAPLQLMKHIVGVRPAVVDAAYGVDVVVPGAGGLVRLVGWYNPGRGEGGLGLRLM